MVKVGTIVIMVLMVGLVFAMFGSVLDDFQRANPDVEVNETLYEGYEFTSQIENETIGIQTALEGIADADGFWETIGTSITAIPSFVINVITLILTTIGYANTIMTGVLARVFHLPIAIIFILEVILFVGIIFALIAFWRKSPA